MYPLSVLFTVYQCGINDSILLKFKVSHMFAALLAPNCIVATNVSSAIFPPEDVHFYTFFLAFGQRHTRWYKYDIHLQVRGR